MQAGTPSTPPGATPRARLLEERYGAPPRRSRAVLLALAAVVAVVGSGWLVWTAWFHSTPGATSQLVGYEVVDVHTATGTLDVVLGEGVDPATVRCTLRAFAWDHATVGELVFAPAGSGRQVLEMRTEREATSVESVGCTTPEQRRPR